MAMITGMKSNILSSFQGAWRSLGRIVLEREEWTIRMDYKNEL